MWSEPISRAREAGKRLATSRSQRFLTDPISFRYSSMRKRVGLFKGELWLEATTAAPLRLWGDFVKSPSIFVRNFRFVQDYQRVGHCFQPRRLLLTVETRIVGKAEMAVWLDPVDDHSAAATPG